LAKFTTDYINLIASNLRDRYRTGFPILKELVQNADDAGATALAFGYHAGFAHAADHPLLQGPALWILNNGRFLDEDRKAIHSFGLNSKAAESGTIGKFGLGMKSVFHLCESFFYVAHDGQKIFREIPNPWLQDAGSSAMHEQWENITERDLACLRGVADAQPEVKPGETWFLLWVPLRMHAHIAVDEGRETAAIIDRYPGESGGQDLDFFTEPDIDQRIGALLPLLRNLQRVRFGGTATWRAFDVWLELNKGSRRLDHVADGVQMAGMVCDDRPDNERLHFLARQYAPSCINPFAELLNAPAWPRSMALLGNGKRGQVPDKAKPEGAVLLGHADKRQGRLILQWAVFLPTEELRFSYEARIPNSFREYRIVLHGQFFVDAGRRGIEDMDVLHKPHEQLPVNAPQSSVLRCWNQALAQEVVLPHLLESLSEYVAVHKLKDDEIRVLTQALNDCATAGDVAAAGRGSSFFSLFRQHVCRDHGWVRQLAPTGASWVLVVPTACRLLSLPPPVKHDSERPWRALPGLAGLRDTVFVDSTAPRLVAAMDNWEPAMVLDALGVLGAATLKSGADLEYLVQFLEMEAERALNTGEVQDALVDMLRKVLQQVSLTEVRQNKGFFRRLVSLLPLERRFALGTRDVGAKGALSDAAYRELVTRPTRALLLPVDLAPDGPAGTASEADLDEWLQGLARNMEVRSAEPVTDVESILTVAESLIKAAGDALAQTDLLRRNTSLRILKAIDGRDGKNIAVSLSDLVAMNRDRLLFKVSNPNKPLGLVADLCRGLPEAKALVVRAPTAQFVHSATEAGTHKVPGHEDPSAILAAAGWSDSAPVLGGADARSRLLELAASADLGDPSIVRGLRYLLHGSAQHYADNAILWKDPSSQQSPWIKLWRMTGDSSWNVLPYDLCAAIPDKCSKVLRIQSVGEESVFNRLKVCRDFSQVRADDFSIEDLDLILGRVTDEMTWCNLPLHRDSLGRFGRVDATCHLGLAPHLPDGIGGTLRFIEHSADEAHDRHQTRWISHWTGTAATQVVLKSSQYAQHWRFLLDQLNVDSNLRNRPSTEWMSVAWLPLKNGQGIALESLIDLQGLQPDITDLARKCDFSFAGLDDLDDEVLHHAGFSRLREQVASGDDALLIFGQMMSAAGLSIGGSLAHLPSGGASALSILSRLTTLPAWTILAKVADLIGEEAVTLHLMAEVATQLSTDQAQGVLEEFQTLGSDGKVRKLYLLYLQEWCRSGSVADIKARLPSMSLLSEAGTWQPATTLVSGVFGVDPARLLEKKVAKVLAELVVTNDVAPQATIFNNPAIVDDWDGEMLALELEIAFEVLVQSSAQPAAGAVFGLFGPSTTALATSWMGAIAYEDYLSHLGWKDPGHDSGFDQKPKWMSGKSVREALATLKPTLRILPGERVNVRSILGEMIEAIMLPVDQAKTLLAGNVSWQGGNGVVVSMRPPATLLDCDAAEQKNILRRTAEDLLGQLYNQPYADLSSLWALFENADQVTLDVARMMILDGLPQSLRQLGSASKNKKISAMLSEIDKARQDLASAKTAGRKTAGSQDYFDDVLSKLAELVKNDDEVQAALLSGARERVSQNQYELDSIPFEIFQNADDAVSELQQMQQAEGRPEFDCKTIGRFVMQNSDSLVRFMHWGRPVNYAGRNASHRPDFANDLERMLMLGASSKSGEEDVTGKFGLGFKSVLLATDRPRVWSGDLCFEVLAGCLPQRWTASTEAREFQQAHNPASSVLARRSTLVELALESGEVGSDLSARFSALAGMSTVFSRHIRNVVIDGTEHRWSPTVVLETGVCRIETGDVQLPTKTGSIRSRLLVLRSRTAAIGLRLDATGVIAFDHNARHPVPAVWVTAPMRGTSAKGLMINAEFHIDTGRASLAMGKTARSNRKLMLSIADEMTEAMVALQLRVEQDWEALSGELECSQQTSAAGFWFGLWKMLFSQEPGSDSSEDVRLVDTFVGRLFRGSAGKTGKVATGMAGEAGSFIGIDELCLSLKLERLGAVVPVLQEWPAFVEAYPVKGWCAEEVQDWLQRSGLQGDQPLFFKLDQATILAMPTLGQLKPKQLVHLANVIMAWPKGPLEEKVWTGLDKAKLQTRSGSWMPAKNILHGDMKNLDLLARFLPQSLLLHEVYDCRSAEWQFIQRYLPRFQSDSASFASWCLSAVEIDAQSAVVQWLLRNQYEPVIELVRRRRLEASWIVGLNIEHVLLHDLRDEERRSLLAKLGLLVDAVAVEEPAVEVLDLHTIHRWWQTSRERHMRDYEKKLWPARVNRMLLVDVPYDRTAWMTLFSLAIFRRYGRTTDEQNRGFLDFLHARGWWETVCHVAPDIAPEAWMDILREYGESQMSTPLFEQWMDSFPRLYRVARWLETYVHLFQTLDLRTEKEAAELLSPGMDASLSGSGIDAPTLTGMLRLGVNLVVRELLRADVLNSSLAERLAYMPRSSLLALMEAMGHFELQSSQDIHAVLVSELGEDNARFNGDYDIPLQLLASSPQLQQEVLAWAREEQWADDEDDFIEEEVI
jgi:hypothetical protein